MTKKASRELLVLAAIVAVVIVAVVARRSDILAGSAPAPSNPARSAAPAVAKTQQPVADVKLELLKAAQSRLEPSTRNPFQFKPRAAPPAPPRPAAARGAPVIEGPPPPPPGPPPPPPLAPKYIGVHDTGP